jgi:hypothetical protein
MIPLRRSSDGRVTEAGRYPETGGGDLPQAVSLDAAVHLRLVIVPAARGGALAWMLPAFRWGLGGRQDWSWISLEDVLGAVEWALENDRVSGAVNTVAPEAVTNASFTATLAKGCAHGLQRCPSPPSSCIEGRVCEGIKPPLREMKRAGERSSLRPWVGVGAQRCPR